MKIDVIAGCQDFALVAAASPWRPFDARVTAFLGALAERLHRHPRAAAHIDTVGLAFFCRRTHVEALRVQHAARCASAVGRGLSFHIAPSNVPINFAYSLLLGLLTGNSCIVRASSKEFAETTIVCEALTELLAEPQFGALTDRLSVVRYERDRATNDYFSALCDVRLIWGGDATMAEIRKSPLPPRATDIAFADRYSACVIDAAGYLATADRQAVALGFYNDTYRNRQAACTAPRLVYWRGDAATVAEAQATFWSALDAVLAAKHEVTSQIDTVDKLMTLSRLALAMPSSRAARAPRITRIAVSALAEPLTQFVCQGGLFVEFRSDGLAALRQIANGKLQTLTYIGIAPEAIAREVAFSGVKGVDRIVPSGRASEFDLYWDGYDLLVSLTRHVAVIDGSGAAIVGGQSSP